MLVKNRKLEELTSLKNAIKSNNNQLIRNSFKMLLENRSVEDVDLYIKNMKLVDLHGSDVFNRFDKYLCEKIS